MWSEQRARKKISKILSRLEPQAAARVAGTMAQEFAIDTATAGGVAGEPQQTPEPVTPPPNDDARPSFLRTEYRIEVGKELLEKEKSGNG